MEQNHGRNSLLEKELKKGVVKSTDRKSVV